MPQADAASFWQLAGGGRRALAPFLVAGILNVTPDSFSDGGRYLTPDAWLGRLRDIARQGAGMVDIGAESTRPGAEDIGPDEEWRRLAPALASALRLRLEPSPLPGPPVAIAVDTFRAATAAAALDIHRSLEPGCPPVDAVNDISGATLDPAMADVLAAFKPGFVLCHCPAPPAVMQRAPRYDNVVDQVEAFFEERLRALTAAGLPEANICLDPGIGFGKSPRHNLALMAAAPRFARLGRPLYYGVSRKSLFAQFPLEDRDPPTMAAVALLAALGVAIHRVHNVPAAVAALGLAEALKGEGRSEEG